MRCFRKDSKAERAVIIPFCTYVRVSEGIQCSSPTCLKQIIYCVRAGGQTFNGPLEDWIEVIDTPHYSTGDLVAARTPIDGKLYCTPRPHKYSLQDDMVSLSRSSNDPSMSSHIKLDSQ